jgi:hypothetical protein
VIDGLGLLFKWVSLWGMFGVWSWLEAFRFLVKIGKKFQVKIDKKFQVKIV